MDADHECRRITEDRNDETPTMDRDRGTKMIWSGAVLHNSIELVEDQPAINLQRARFAE
jgi:hypothetical protein